MGGNDDWRRDFFQGLALDLWRAAFPLEVTARECDFLEAELELGKGHRLLDAPCGTGRHSIELCRRGASAFGVDTAAEYVDEANERAAALGLDATFTNMDMLELDMEEEFDGAICLGNSFGLLQYHEIDCFLDGVFRALKPGGRLIMDTLMCAESLLPDLRDRFWLEAGGVHCLLENEYIVERSMLATTYTFIREAKVEVRRSFHPVLTAAMVRDYLARAGFGDHVLYGSMSRAPFALGSSILVVRAVKS